MANLDYLAGSWGPNMARSDPFGTPDPLPQETRNMTLLASGLRNPNLGANKGPAPDP